MGSASGYEEEEDRKYAVNVLMASTLAECLWRSEEEPQQSSGSAHSEAVHTAAAMRMNVVSRTAQLWLRAGTRTPRRAT